MTSCLTLLFTVVLLTCVLAKDCQVSIGSLAVTGVCDEGGSKYLSIPYAQPPVDNLRFAVAKELDTSGEKQEVDGSQLPPICPQFALTENDNSVLGQEDCLYLNVYVPGSAGGNLTSKKPVMVYIHGGSFIAGSSSDPTLDGTKLSQAGDVIVVTLNYRLGYLGYYDSADTGTNFGMSDVIMALNWIKSNISKFGGDSDKVTLFGESSGATMVRYLLNSNRANNLFTRAIIQSDPQCYGPSEKSVSQNILSAALLKATNCDSVDCLRALSLEKLISAEMQIFTSVYMGQVDGVTNINFPISPNVDGDYIKSDLSETLGQNHNVVNPVDIIIGTTKDEAGSFIDFDNMSSTNDSSDELTQKLINKMLNPCTNANTSSLSTNTLIKLGTKVIFSCPSRINAQTYASLNPDKNVFVYEFTMGIPYATNTDLPYCTNRICHQDDLYLVFGTYSDATTSNDLKQLSQSVQNLWTSFAASGTPNNKGLTWNKVDEGSLNYLDIGQNQMKSTDLNVSCSSALLKAAQSILNNSNV
ncbi:hypothetical protein TRICI_003107 [Trichomonascus ciferrii]|uniref:Carboxylic ester hydrolase n=1 Tax=Trichomonascus ciferrii TaxID=44093 RepID=A0A642V4W0_9ASCO|nr:hypothetical protein TRICI_003107 [Trichomonascus ciferrii]